ncbi:TraB/GumN family protein [Candidatus Woesearchaeota archaeon]|nr:TraB/GumN family protein [Candidatus Woesearchaeota archaeon]
MIHKNLIVIGTSHIAKESLKEVEDTIKKEKPDIVALELDRKRFFALLQKEKRGVRISDIGRIGFKGYLFALLGAWAEKKLGSIVGVQPGSEMVAAIKLAKKNNIRVALIDQDIEVTLKKFSKSLTWKEKLNFVKDIFKGFLMRRKLEFDLNKVPSKEIIRKLTDEVKKNYPNVYRVLVIERNEVMAANLKKIMLENPKAKIAAIVGAGHEEEIIGMIKA